MSSDPGKPTWDDKTWEDLKKGDAQLREELKLPDWLNPKKIDVKIDLGKILAEAFDKQVISKLPWYKRWIVRFCLALAQMFLAVCRWFLKV